MWPELHRVIRGKCDARRPLHEILPHVAEWISNGARQRLSALLGNPGSYRIADRFQRYAMSYTDFRLSNRDGRVKHIRSLYPHIRDEYAEALLTAAPAHSGSHDSASGSQQVDPASPDSGDPLQSDGPSGPGSSSQGLAADAARVFKWIT